MAARNPQHQDIMSPKAQRIAIAEACGWVTGGDPDFPKSWRGPKGEWHSHNPPDYLRDTNAMREAFQILPQFHKRAYGRHLQEVLNIAVVGFVSDYHEDLASLADIANASADQLAEVFLKTLGLWTS
jgi:hypothetical protein